MYPLMRRRSSLFENPNQGYPSIDFQFPEAEAPAPPNPNRYDLGGVYGQMSQMQGGPAQTRYQKFLDENEPDRANYKPSKASKIGAILAGIGEGISNGPARGMATTNQIMDSGYDEALKDYGFKAGRLKEAADTEEKSINNRVKTFRDIEEFNQRRASNEELERYHQGLLKDRAEQRANERTRNSSQGYNYFTDPNSGKRYGVKPNPDGSFSKIDFGMGGLPIDSQVDLAGRKAGAEAKARQPFELGQIGARGAQERQNIGARGEEQRKGIQERFKQAKDLVQFKADYTDWQYKINDKGNIIAFNPKDPWAEPIDTGVNSGKLSDKEKAELGLKNAKELKQTPGAAPPNKTVTTKVEGNERTTKTEFSGKKVEMIDPDGNHGMIDESEVEEALKHKWKKVGG